ncbi:hypothetical protein TNCV_1715041 [Trichonephila clavipes]|nr:hypothetical protein TNCV_1715041 [Trichonephila clavipes]
MQKIDSAMSYDYTACKKSPECSRLGWVLSAKLNPSAGSHRQSSVATLWRGNWVPKSFAAVGIAYKVSRLKALPACGKCTKSAKVKNANAILYEKKQIFLLLHVF